MSNKGLDIGRDSQAGCRRVVSKILWNWGNSSHKGTEVWKWGKAWKTWKRTWPNLDTFSWKPVQDLCLSPLHSGQRPQNAAFYSWHQKGWGTDTVFRQKRATSGVTINQHIRKPMIQPLLRMKAIRYGPSVGNFLKYMSEIMNLVSCTINYRESWIPFPSLPLA